MKFSQIIKLVRPHHWLKNFLIFVPLITAHRFQVDIFLDGLIAFFLFSFTASCGYVLNDIIDKEFDKNHPFKKNRPIASGEISLNQAIVIMSIFFIISFVYAFQFNIDFLLSLLIYFFVSSAYSLYFKKIVLLDIIILATLYSFRIVSGSIALEIPLSFWLIIFSMFFFLSLGCIKRLSEIVSFEDFPEKKLHGRGYLISDKDLITQISLISGFISALVILLYIRSDEIKILYVNIHYLYFISMIIIYWISRINLKAIRGEVHFDPLLFAIQDKVSIACLFLMLCLILLAAYSF